MSSARGTTGEVRFFGVLRESPALHFYLMQALGFAYLAYRFASRDYTVHGLLPDGAFGFPRPYQSELWPIPPLSFTTFQVVYEVLPRPGVEVLRWMQLTVVGASLAGLFGVLPRLCAAVAFLIGAHVTGMMQSAGADVDGGTLILCLMLILALSPSRNFYALGRFRPGTRSVDHHWPVFLLFVVVGTFYTFSGINKVVEIGFDWPFTLHLENLAEVGIEQALFVSERLRFPEVSAVHRSYALSVFGGLVTLVGEAGYLGILWLPRYRLFFAVSMIALHVLVFLMQGINFVGSSVVILLCVDWNALARRGTVLWDGGCGVCRTSVGWIRRLDWFGRLETLPIAESGHLPVDAERLTHEMGFLDENGDVSYGADAFGELATRCPLLWPLAILLRVPGAIQAARPVYRLFASHRHKLGAACRLD